MLSIDKQPNSNNSSFSNTPNISVWKPFVMNNTSNIPSTNNSSNNIGRYTYIYICDDMNIYMLFPIKREYTYRPVTTVPTDFVIIFINIR